MFLQNIFELSVPGKKKSLLIIPTHCTTSFCIKSEPQEQGCQVGYLPPSDFGLDRSKPSPSKGLVSLFGICPSPHRIFISSYGSASIVAAGHITVNYTEECHSEDGHFKTYFQGQRN